MSPAIRNLRSAACLFGILEITVLWAAAQGTTFQLDPSKTEIHFALDAALHTVHGTFQAKPAELRLDPVSGALSGEIVVDARSGRTGNGLRDRKMHKDVLESEQYPEISFRADHVAGVIASQGNSALKIHGIFQIHGVDRDIEVPAQLEMSGTNWTAKIHFTIPYAKWGMKNPSTLFLRVSDSVQIDIAASGAVGQGASTRPDPTQ